MGAEDQVEEEQVYEEEDEPISFVDPHDEKFVRLQSLIEAQFKTQLQELEEESKSQDTELKQIKDGHQTTAVELYNFQQKLAKLQTALEQSHDTEVTVQQLREQTELQRNEYHQNAVERKQQLDEQRKRMYAYQTEHDKLSLKLRQVAINNEQIVSDVYEKRRETYKAEEQMEKFEKEKKEQDFLIDRMNEQIKTLESRFAMYDSQYQAQRKETKVARGILTEAQTEMESINFEKKQLIQDWKTSVIGMQRRDEALKSTEDGLKKQFEQQLEIENEIQGYKGSINAEKEKHEELTSILIKHENEKSYIEKQQDELDDVLAKKQQQYLNYKATLEQTDLQIKKAENEAKVVRNEMSGIDQRIIKLSNEMRGLEDSMLHVLSEQTTFKRDYQTTLLEIEKKRNQIRDLQVETSQEENELARMTIDKLQSEDHNKQLSQILAQLEDDLKKKDTLLEKYESEIRKKHDEIERKQAYEDKLNRQYDKLLASQQEENYGPLEATIHNLQKAIEAKIRENEQLKKDWTRYQNELVTLVNKSDELNGDLQKIRAKQTILTQKKNRLDGDTIKEREGIAEMSTSMRHMHSEMVKLNSTISENGKLEKTLADTNFDMENKILASLQEREREALKLEDTIRDLREKKRDLLDELLEVERAIRYWSKKIELQKEIQEAVDPEVGQEEITRMKKEIHIMEQRLIILKRNARAKVEDMERAILKRAIILDKGNAATKNAKNKSSNIKANVQREVSQLNKELTTRKTESTKTLALIKKFQDEAMQTGERIDQTRAEAEEIKQQMNFLTADIQKLQLSKMRAVMEKDMVSKINEKCQAIVKGKKYNMSVKANDVEAIDRELQKQLAKRDGIIKAVEYIRKEFETYSEQLEVVVEALN